MNLPNLNTKLSQWLLLIFVSFIWGTSFILMKRSLESFTEIQVGSFRILFASVFMLPVLLKRYKKFKKKHIKPLLTVSFIGNFFPAILFAKAQTGISSSLAAMLNTLFPITAVITGTLFYGLKFKKNKIAGTIVGLIGALGLASGNGTDFSDNNNMYALYVIVAVIFYAVSLNEIKSKLKDTDGITITAFAFAITGPFAGITLMFTDLQTSFAKPEALKDLMYIALLAFGSSAVAVSLFYLLLDYVDIVFASLTTYIIPIFAIFWGIFDGEKISFMQIFYMLIIFAGVYLVNKNKPEQKKT
ncbi:MAG: DMT family transporter [Chlorobi bacterium]|nr:DMT family transporter [Chlorobiota bacterium]